MTKKEFLRFLKENNIYISLINNIKIYGKKDPQKLIDGYIKLNEPSMILMSGFVWDDDKKLGEIFWQKIYSKLYDIVSHEKRK